MSGNIVPRRGEIIGSPLDQPVSRATARHLATVHERGLIREARVQVEASITSAKLRELDYMAYEAMSGQAMLHRWGALLAGDDLLLADDVSFYKDMVKIGKGEVIADLVTKYRRV